MAPWVSGSKKEVLYWIPWFIPPGIGGNCEKGATKAVKQTLFTSRRRNIRFGSAQG